MGNGGPCRRLADEEVRLLFAQYAPMQPMPVDLVTRIQARVMVEVALTFHKRPPRWSSPALPPPWPFTGVRGSRRR